MTERSYPFVDGATTDAEFSAMFRQVFPASVIDGLGVSADSTGLSVKLPVGSGFVRGHYYKNTADQSLPIDPGGTSPRIDTVVLKLEYGTANSISVQVKKGTPASDPNPPALTQTDTGVFEFALADVYVTASAVTIAAADVTDRRMMYADAVKKLLGLSSMAASVITSGVFNSDRIPGLPASKTTSGVFDQGRIPNLNAVDPYGRLTSHKDGQTGAERAYLEVRTDIADAVFAVNYNGTTILKLSQTGVVTVAKVPFAQVDELRSAAKLDASPSVVASNVVQRWADGSVIGPDPVNPSEYTNKAYVDGRTPKVAVQSSAPSNPSTGDLWVW